MSGFLLFSSHSLSVLVSVGAASVSECLLSEILKNNELLISRLDHDLGHLTDHQTYKLLDNQIKKLLENSQTF